MKTELLVTLLFLFSIFGVKLNESANSNEVLCRVIRNLRKDVISQLQPRFPETNPSNCAILDNCSSVNCSLPILNQGKEFVSVGLDLNWCDANPWLRLWSNSSYFVNSFWEKQFSVSTESQKLQVPWINGSSDALGSDKAPKWNLTVNLFESHSQTSQQTALGGRFLSLDAVLEMCQGVESCSALLLLKIPPVSLSQVCDDPQTDTALTPKPLDSLKIESLDMNFPSQDLYTYSDAGKSCAHDEPFSCGIGGNCRLTSVREGICECLPNYEYGKNGICGPKIVPVTPPDENPGGSASTIWGAFFAIVTLILIGAFIFYGVRYNIFNRLKNRLPLYFNNFCPFQRVTVVQVNDQLSMANPLYDSDDPTLM